jgi:hypothetical protein
MSAALHSIVRLMPFNSKVEQIESRTASWKGLCSTFEGLLYIEIWAFQKQQYGSRAGCSLTGRACYRSLVAGAL